MGPHHLLLKSLNHWTLTAAARCLFSNGTPHLLAQILDHLLLLEDFPLQVFHFCVLHLPQPQCHLLKLLLCIFIGLANLPYDSLFLRNLLLIILDGIDELPFMNPSFIDLTSQLQYHILRFLLIGNHRLQVLSVLSAFLDSLLKDGVLFSEIAHLLV